MSTRAPAATVFFTSASREATASALASGPSCVLSSNGSPTRSSFMRWTNLRSNSSAIFSAHNKALGCNARLPVVLDARVDRGRNRRVQIGARHYNERIAAAQFEHDFLDALGGGYSDLNSRCSLPVNVAATTRESFRIPSTGPEPISSV